MYDEGDKVIVLSSKTLGHARELLQTIKDVLDYSEPFRAIYGYWGRHSARTWARDIVVLKDGTVIVAKGTGQQVHGIKFGDQRPTLFVLDDPEDENNTKTNEAMEYNLRWLLQAVVPCIDAKRGRILVIGTPEHQRCIVETIKHMGDWYTQTYSALIPKDKYPEDTPEYLQYDALWEELFNVQELLAKRNALDAVGRVSIFNKQYLCKVTGDRDQMFGKDVIMDYEGVYRPNTKDRGGMLTVSSLYGQKLDQPIPYPVNVFTGIDPASSTRDTADYSTIVSEAVNYKDWRFCLPYYNKRVKPMELASAILQRDTLYRPNGTRIESIAYQEMLRDYIRSKRSIPGLSQREMPRTKKELRIESMQPHFYEKRMFFTKAQTEMRDQLLMFPRSKYDDLLDGLYMANKIAYKPQLETSKYRQEALEERGEEDDLWQIL
jgi:hypothetical protein